MLRILSFLIVISLLSCSSPEARREKAKELNNKAMETGRFRDSDSNSELALDMLNEAIETDPTFVGAYGNKMKFLLQLNRHKEALETAKEAIVIDPDHDAFIQFAGMLHDFFEQPDSAMIYYKRAYEIGKNRLQEDTTDVLKWITHIFNQKFIEVKEDSVLAQYEYLKEKFPDHNWELHDFIFYDYDKNKYVQEILKRK